MTTVLQFMNCHYLRCHCIRITEDLGPQNFYNTNTNQHSNSEDRNRQSDSLEKGSFRHCLMLPVGDGAA